MFAKLWGNRFVSYTPGYEPKDMSFMEENLTICSKLDKLSFLIKQLHQQKFVTKVHCPKYQKLYVQIYLLEHYL